MTSVIPKLREIEQGASYSDKLEFMTIRGKETFYLTGYKTRSIVLGIVHVEPVL